MKHSSREQKPNVQKPGEFFVTKYRIESVYAVFTHELLTHQGNECELNSALQSTFHVILGLYTHILRHSLFLVIFLY